MPVPIRVLKAFGPPAAIAVGLLVWATIVWAVYEFIP